MAPESPSAQFRLRLETIEAVSDWFDWAELSIADADRVVHAAGLSVIERFEQTGRWFLVAGRDGAARPWHRSAAV